MLKQKIYIMAKTKIKSNRGGPRAGAGAPTKYKEGKAISVTYSVPEKSVPYLNKVVSEIKEKMKRHDREEVSH